MGVTGRQWETTRGHKNQPWTGPTAGETTGDNGRQHAGRKIGPGPDQRPGRQRETMGDNRRDWETTRQDKKSALDKINSLSTSPGPLQASLVWAIIKNSSCCFMRGLGPFKYFRHVEKPLHAIFEPFRWQERRAS